ncbi:hypothetical protein [Blastopirellula marina]|uniref:Uncharacterized protein n=1 Tax=Blastopirellula marina DSM 3645 TaxID=314230 RepID=A3ZM97_9BACT|nr:hypothetical protein [Blastopirellula marina]EAQ82066.1 hypothetical protein DSM3645_00090 [Blastopirellula marina DSM 3645]
MTRNLIFAALVGIAASAATAGGVQAGWPVSYNGAAVIAAENAQTYPWHGGYYYENWHTPMALVVPPTASLQTNYSWGVPSSRVTPINHQFTPVNPGPVGDVSQLSPTPYWPSNTYQFGVYYVRGPWQHREPNPYSSMHHHHGGGGGSRLFHRGGAGCGNGNCNGNCPTCR